MLRKDSDWLIIIFEISWFQAIFTHTLSHSTLVNQNGFSETFQDFIRSGVRWLEWSLNSILTKENMR